MVDFGLKGIVTRLAQNLSRDNLVQNTTNRLRNYLNCDRVVLYYFYNQWQGQVTFESLSNSKYSIFGSQGPNECFNQEYANLYKANRISWIANIETAAIADCHREFLSNLQVKANLVAPILPNQKLWGLLIAHHCQNIHEWSKAEINAIKQEANQIAQAESIRNIKL